MAVQHTQVQTHQHAFRWSFRKKGKDVLKICRQLTVVITLAGGLSVLASPAHANPSGGNVTAGSATISSAGSTTTIHQTSNRAVIEWGNFDIAAGETTQFIQPGSNAIALNRVVNSSQVTSINGNLLANGRVLVINPNGVLIGPSGNVDVSGFVASTADIGDTRFMTATGAMEFDRAGKLDAGIENQGRITIRDAGLGVLVAPNVRNSGVIEGSMAKLHMGAGDTFAVDFYGDGLLHLAVVNTDTPRTIKAENAGTIVANAGKVVMTAAAANNVVNSVINTSGVIEAKGLLAKGGEIILTGSGASVRVAGKVDASGKTGGGSVKVGGDVKGEGSLAKATRVEIAQDAQIAADAGTSGDGGSIVVWSDVLTTSRGRYSAKGGSGNGNGGFVETSSKNVLDVGGSLVDTSAANGSFGMWLLDPITLTVDAALASTINNSLSNYSLVTSDGLSIAADINITAAGAGLYASAGAGGITMNNQSISLNGGNLVWNTTGAIDINNSTIVTKGGDIGLTSTGSHPSTKVKINNSDINTTGGATSAVISLTENGSPKLFSNVYGGGSTLTQTANGGDFIISGRNLEGNSLCLAAGGAGCGAAAIPPAPIALNVLANSYVKLYGAADPAVLGYTVSAGALMSGDSWTGVLTRAAGGNVGTYSIGIGSLAVVTSGAYTYTINFTPGTLTIDPAALTITAHSRGKTYGDNLVLGTAAFDAVGLQYADTVTGVVLNSAGAAATSAAGSYTISASDATGLNLSNYTINYAAGTLTVDRAALIVTAQNQSKIYGANYNLGSTAFTTSGLLNSDNVTGATLASTGAVGTANVGNYGITTSNAVGTGVSNYTITYAGGMLTVDPALLSITASDQTKTYGDAFNLGNTAFTVAGLVNTDVVNTVTLRSAGRAASAAVGDYAISASSAIGTGLSNYNVRYLNGTLAVDPAALTITANNRSKTYGDTLALGNTAFTTSGLRNSDVVTDVALSSAGALAAANAGNYAVVGSAANGSGLGNYTVSYVNGNLQVNRAALTVTANNRSKVYGSALSMGTTQFTTSGLQNSDTVTGVTLSSSGRFAVSGVGTYNIAVSNASGSGLSNYTVGYANGTLTVTPATLTVTARNQNKIYGNYRDVDSALLPFNVSGLKNFDFVTDVSLSSAGGAATASVGDYGIVASSATGFGLSNYNINYVNGTLTVNPALLLITADSFSKTYGDLHTFDNSDYGVIGLKNSDTVAGVTLSSHGAAPTSNVGLYGIFGSNAVGSGLGNYAIAYIPGLMLVNPAALTITAQDQSKTYGSNLNLGTTAFDVTGLKNSDAVNTVALSSAGAVGTANAGSYAIDVSGASGMGLSNYTVNYVDGALTVNRAALMLVANNQTKDFGTEFLFNGSEFTTVGTLYNGDSVNSATLTSPGSPAAASELFSPYVIYASNANGTGLANYDIGYVNGLMTVNPPPYNPALFFSSLNRPIVSLANNVIVRDAAFEGVEVRTLDTDVALRYRSNGAGNASSTGFGNASSASALANLEPAAGGEMSAEDLANLEPAAGGDDVAQELANLEPAAGGDLACANSFLDNEPCDDLAQ